MKKKYMIRPTDGRIVALRNFGGIKKYQVGGWIDSEDNLSHEGLCWVDVDAQVRDNARVSEDARIRGVAVVEDQTEVTGGALVADSAVVSGDSRVGGSAIIRGCSYVADSMIGDYAVIKDDAMVVASWVGGSVLLVGNMFIEKADLLMQDQLLYIHCSFFQFTATPVGVAIGYRFLPYDEWVVEQREGEILSGHAGEDTLRLEVRCRNFLAMAMAYFKVEL